jgi:hypothetical protein
VQTPMRKKYTEGMEAARQLKEHYLRCRTIVEEEGGIYINGNEKTLSDSLFADVSHLNFMGAKSFTKSFLDSLKIRLDTAGTIHKEVFMITD